MSAGLPLRSYERSAPKKDSMKQFILLIVCLFVSTFASATEQQAIVTFYWPGEIRQTKAAVAAVLWRRRCTGRPTAPVTSQKI